MAVIRTVTTNPQDFTEGNFPRSICNGDSGSGRFHWKFTHTNSSTGRGGYTAQMAQATGGLWHNTAGDFELYDTSDALLGAHASTWTAGAQTDYKVNWPALTYTLTGFATGSGTYSFTAGNGSFFQSGTVRVGGAAGVSGFGEAGTFTDIDDDVSAVTGDLTATGGATAAFVGASTKAGDVTATGGAAAAFVGSRLQSGALTATGGASAAFTTGLTAGGDLVATAGATAAFEGASTKAGALTATGGSIFAGIGARLFAAVLVATAGATAIFTTSQAITQVAATVKQRINATGSPTGTLTTDGVTTPATGAGFLYFVARGNWDQVSSPTLVDSEGNTPGAARASGPHAYGSYPNAKTAIYYAGGTGNAGGGHTVGAPYDHADGDPAKGDEVTVGLIGLLGNGTTAPILKSSSWVERAAGSATITSGTVTTSSAGRIYFGLFGSAGIGQLHTFTGVTSGLVKVTAASAETDPNVNGYIQVTWFYLDVPSAGTYSATFAGTSNEGAQIYAGAFQIADFVDGALTATAGASASFVGSRLQSGDLVATGGATGALVGRAIVNAALTATGGAEAEFTGGTTPAVTWVAEGGAEAAFVGSRLQSGALTATGGATFAAVGELARGGVLTATGGASFAGVGARLQAGVLDATGGAVFLAVAPVVPFDPDVGGGAGGEPRPGVGVALDPIVSNTLESV